MGYLALFVALTATAWAAPKITSKQIGKNAVKAKHIADGQVGSLEVTDNALTGTDIDESTLKDLPGGGANYSAAGPLTLTGASFGLQSCPANQVLKQNGGGTAWDCAPDVDTNSGGTVTSVNAGNGLEGGPVTTTGTISLRSCPDDTILKVVVVGWQCLDDETQPTGPASGDLQDFYPNPTLAPGAVSGGPAGEIQDFTVDQNDLETGSVGPDQIGTMPAASASNVTGTSVGAAEDYKAIELPTEAFDTAAMHSTVTNSERIVAPRPGLYQVSATVRFGATNVDGGRAARIRAIGPLINFSFAWQAVQELDTSPVTDDTVINLSGAVPLSTGDHVQVEADHKVPGGINVIVSPLTMYWAGPKP